VGFGKKEDEAATLAEERTLAATEATDQLFRQAKMHIMCPPRWRILFLAAAKRLEAKFDQLREELFIAVAMDDTPSVVRIEKEVPEQLWKWWAYDLSLVARARDRGRPQLLEVLPPLYGQAYPSVQSTLAAQQAMEVVPTKNSSQDILSNQRALVLTGIVRKALDIGSEIDVEEMRRRLDDASSGSWRTTDVPATGVNYAPTSQDKDFIGWRVLHFVAACFAATETSAPAAELLLDAKADPRLQDASGATPLHTAAMRNSVSVVEILLARGGPVELADLSGCTPALSAARARNAGILRRISEWVLPTDASVEMLGAEEEVASQRYNPDKGVVLHREVAAGDRPKVSDLVLVGDGLGGDLADVNFTDSAGRSSMHVAAVSISDDERAADMVRALASMKGNVDLRNGEGEAPLHVAVRAGRPAVVRALLRLRAHAALPDRKGHTPLMLAANGALQKGMGQPHPYDGSLVNEAFDWRTINAVLQWHGEGEPPGPPMRKAEGPLPGEEDDKDTTQLLSKTRKLTAEEKAEFFHRPDCQRARGLALAALGFDDQKILDDRGRANRGDRIQMFKHLFAPDKAGTMKPRADRLHLLWRSLTDPMLRMEIQGTLPDRLSELLQYLLTTVFGKRGAVFGMLVTTNVGTTIAHLPLRSWDEFADAVKDEDDLADRAAEVCRMAFRKPLPKFMKWVGATWARDSYPRDAETAPWGAFEYVDRDNAPKLNEFQQTATEPFAECTFPFQEQDAELPTGSKLLAHRSDQWRLGDRLFVDEAMGMRGLVADRVELIGTKLLCPLLLDSAHRLTGKGGQHDEGADERRKLLQYIAAQMSAAPDITRRELEAHFKKAWQQASNVAAQALFGPVPAELVALTTEPDVVFRRHTGDQVATSEANPPPDQVSLLPIELTHALRSRHSCRAFIELRQCGALTNADDFNKVVCDTSAHFPKAFIENFWRGAYFLLLWGRGKRLQSVMNKELRRRLPLDKVEGDLEVRGPRIRPRCDVMLTGDPPVAWRSARLTASVEAVVGGNQDFQPGLTDILRAEVVCQTPEDLVEVFHALCHAPTPTHSAEEPDDTSAEDVEGAPETSEDGEAAAEEALNAREDVSLEVVRIINDFRAAEIGHALPRAAGVLLICVMKVAPRIRGEMVQQLVEVELMLQHTAEARWLAEYLQIVPDTPEAKATMAAASSHSTL